VALFHISYLLACRSHTYPPRGATRRAGLRGVVLQHRAWRSWAESSEHNGRSTDGRSSVVVARWDCVKPRRPAGDGRRSALARPAGTVSRSLAKTRHGTARAPGLHSSRRAVPSAGWLAGSTFYECFKSHRQPGLPSSRLDSRPRHCISKYHPLRSACYHANDQSTRSPSSIYAAASQVPFSKKHSTTESFYYF